jgi:hypothetical protein
MHPQLAAIADEFEAALRRLRQLAQDTPGSWWTKRADPDRWSIGECVAHLNLTSRAYLPLMRQALDEGKSLPRHPLGRRYRRDFTGWMLWRMAGPPVRFAKVRTAAAFVPAAEAPREETLAEFERLQEEQVECVRAAEGTPLGRLRITSPFDPRVKYNLYSCLTILPRHQHRHLWQAEQVLHALRRGGSASS